MARRAGGNAGEVGESVRVAAEPPFCPRSPTHTRLDGNLRSHLRSIAICAGEEREDQRAGRDGCDFPVKIQG